MINKKIYSVFEIILLIGSLFAFAYLISDTTIKSVDAESNYGLGCCFDEVEGLCSPNSLEDSCVEETNGKFLGDNTECEYSDCDLGCCSLGTQTQLVTKTRCDRLASLTGKVSSWDSKITDAFECSKKYSTEEEGACVLESDSGTKCKRTTRGECDSSSIFYSGYLCSYPDFNSTCTKQDYIGCAEDKDEVYWYDSCGNQENIYSSNKDDSWNGGKILSKENSCNSNSNNIDSISCGNCNYELGSICGEYRNGIDKKLIDGDFSCRDLNCYDAPGNANKTQDRVNGESWCVYDGQIGDAGLFSADVVGSEHYKFLCNNGVVESEQCGDHRSQICVQEENDGKDSAVCRTNLWEQCISANTENGCETDCVSKCTMNPDCRIQNVHVADGFKFNACVPKYPPGFDLSADNEDVTQGITDAIGSATGTSSSAGQSTGDSVCSLATRTCTVVWEKQCPGGWVATENKECHDAAFTQQMNNLCVSLGDCGVYTNIEGTMFSFGGAKVEKKGDHGATPPNPLTLIPLYAMYSYAIAGQHASPGSVNMTGVTSLDSLGLNNIFGDGFGNVGNGYNKISTAEAGGGLFSGGQLSSTIGIAGVGGAAGAGVGAGVAAATATPVVAGGTMAGVGVAGAQGATYATAAGAQITVAAGETIPAGATIVAGSGTPAIGLSSVLLPAAIVVAVVLVTMMIMGCGKTETVEITYTCEKWERPFVGNCEKCNENPLKPCTKYRCESLGMNCKIVNEGTGYDQCLASESDAKSPKISVWENIISEGYKYTSVSESGFRVRQSSGECVEPFEGITIGIQTDVPAKCELTFDDESQAGKFLEGDRYVLNHTYSTYTPSKDSIAYANTNAGGIDQTTSDELGSYLLTQLGDMNLYVKCTGVNGVSNEAEYRINFCVNEGDDLTTPVIKGYSPMSESFVKSTKDNQEVTIYTQEPSECKWSGNQIDILNLDETFNLLNPMTCETNVNKATAYGYPCNATLPTPNVENDFYFICRDQPWLGNSLKRNYGQVEKYVLKKSENPLIIESVNPEGSVAIEQSPVETFILKVNTAGGSGDAICSYKLDRYSKATFAETGGTEHTQTFTNLVAGEHDLVISCKDSIGDKVEKTTNLNLVLQE